MSEQPPPLDTELAELVAQHRRIDAAPADVRTRARARLLNAVAVPGSTSNATTSSPATGEPRTARHIERAWTKASALATFLTGGIVGAGLYAVLAKAPPPRVVYVDRTTAIEVPVATPPASPPSPAAPREPPPVNTATPIAGGGGSPSRTSQLSAERIMLDAARAAMAQGDPATAIERLERHRRTFANPILEEEREAMWIQALAKEGHGDEARSRAAAFRKRWPDSLFSAMVLGAIDPAP